MSIQNASFQANEAKVAAEIACEFALEATRAISRKDYSAASKWLSKASKSAQLCASYAGSASQILGQPTI